MGVLRSIRWRWVFAGLAAMPLLAAALLKSDLRDRGTWDCEICGAHEYRTEWCGIAVACKRDAIDPASDAAAFRRWWDAEVHVDHRHHWSRTGSHQIGFDAKALLGHQQIYLRQLGEASAQTPGLRAAALALATADDTVRGAMLAAAHEVLELGRRDCPKDFAGRIAALRRRSPAWDRAIAAVEAAEPR